jgi:predicted XRE-type DNA-binding protein
MSNKIKVTKSSGNVFQDLGVKDAGLHQVKAELGIMLIDLIEKRELTQVRAAVLLGIRQPELSRLKGGNLSHYSVERLLGFLNRLSQRIEIRVRPSTKSKSAETVLA